MSNQIHYDYLIVGAGLFGSMYAYLATRQGKRCLVIDKRPQLGGNLYCEETENIHVHTYGPHIFHTSNKRVWDFVNSLVPFNRFTNTPLACYKDKFYNLPFNMNTFYQMWGVTTPAQAESKLNEQRAKALQKMKDNGITEPRNLEEQALTLVGEDIYNTLIKGYTEKQWGRCCTELPSFIIKRLPVRLVYDNNYFDDEYQGIPKGGYNKLIDELLKGVENIININFFQLHGEWKDDGKYHFQYPADYSKSTSNKVGECSASHIVYTGKIDEFFDYCYGPLEYRTVHFEVETLPMSNFQGNAVVNYTDSEIPYTRIIEHKHFEMFGQSIDKCAKTVISKEYSTEWKSGMEPYYPVNNLKNNTLYLKYKHLADKYNKDLSSNISDKGKDDACIFGGRLAEYKYYDMAPIVEKVLRMFD